MTWFRPLPLCCLSLLASACLPIAGEVTDSADTAEPAVPVGQGPAPVDELLPEACGALAQESAVCFTVDWRWDEDDVIYAIGADSGELCEVSTAQDLISDRNIAIVGTDMVVCQMRDQAPGEDWPTIAVVDIVTGEVRHGGFKCDHANTMDGGVVISDHGTSSSPWYASVDDLLDGADVELPYVKGPDRIMAFGSGVVYTTNFHEADIQVFDTNTNELLGTMDREGASIITGLSAPGDGVLYALDAAEEPGPDDASHQLLRYDEASGALLGAAPIAVAADPEIQSLACVVPGA